MIIMKVIDKQDYLEELLMKSASPHTLIGGESVRVAKEPPLNFSKTTLRGLKFNKINLNNTNFNNCVIEDCTFDQTSCHKANFSYSKIVGTTFTMVDLSDSDFSYAQIGRSKVVESWVHSVKFFESSIDMVDFRASSLQNSDFTRAILTACDFTYTDLENAKLDVRHMEKVIGNGKEIKTLQIGPASSIMYTNKRMAIDSKEWSLYEWWFIKDEELLNFYHPPFLEVWKKWKPILHAIGVFDETIEEYEKNKPIYIGIGDSVLKKKQRKVIL